MWSALAEYWTNLYTGIDWILRVYQESTISSDQFKALARASGIILQFPGVESRNSLGAGERYHCQRRRVFSVMSQGHPQLHG